MEERGGRGVGVSGDLAPGVADVEAGAGVEGLGVCVCKGAEHGAVEHLAIEHLARRRPVDLGPQRLAPPPSTTPRTHRARTLANLHLLHKFRPQVGPGGLVDLLEHALVLDWAL